MVTILQCTPTSYESLSRETDLHTATFKVVKVYTDIFWKNKFYIGTSESESGEMYMDGSLSGVNCTNIATILTLLLLKMEVKDKGKAVPLHALEALGGRGGIAPTHSRPRH
jgi:hypothetical protein